MGDIPCKNSPVVKKGKAKNTQVTDFEYDQIWYQNLAKKAFLVL